MRIGTPLLALAFLVGCSVRPEPLAKQQGSSQQYDIVISNGRIVDGTGNPWFYGDVAISGDHIARIAPAGALRDAAAKERIDARGLVVAPGVIDIQAQSYPELLNGDSRVVSMITQGITTMILGEGDTPAPANDKLFQSSAAIATDTSLQRAMRSFTGPRGFDSWLRAMPPEWQFTEEFATGPVRSGALPMGFNRTPHYARGLLLVGDAGGAVNPFNGEGIAYAMESGELAADVVVQALARAEGPARERAFAAYPTRMKAAYGGYYTLGRVFTTAIGHPQVMRLATRYGLPRPTLMRFTLKLLANLTDPRGGDAMDRIINGLTHLAPAS